MRVAVPRALLEHDAVGLDGRMWRQTLRELDRHVRLRAAEDHSRADVWLSSSLVNPAALGQPLVVQVHEAPWDDPLMAPAYAELMARRTDSAVQAAARVLTASQHGARQIRERHAPRAIDVVPLGVDHAVFRPRGTARRRTVLFVGTVHPRKNLGALREAAARIGVPLELVLSPAADREDSEALLAAAADGAKVHRRMQDDDLAALMERSGVLCIPSLSEGFGLPALEAMACGTPVVASDRGPLPEVVGDAGLLVAPTPEGLAAGLTQALDDHALGARGLQRAAEFTWARTAAGWLATLEAARDAA